MFKPISSGPIALLDQQQQATLRGDFETGWALAEQLAQSHPNNNRVIFNRAFYELRRGDLLKGLACMDAGRWEGVYGDKPLPTNKPIWRDQDLKNKNLLICSEGGLGDEIINARFAKDFSHLGAKVTITCDPSLAAIFSRIEGVSSVVNHRAAPEVYHDYWVPGLSAPRVLNYSYEKLTGRAYLSAEPDYVLKWKSILSTQNLSPKKIGLRFTGNPKFEHENFRRFPKEDLIKVMQGKNFINLQLEETSLPIKTWDDTLGLIANLDLVITSCTSVAHASAALGKPTWVIVPVLPYYLWALPGSTTPWYQSVRVFRQENFGSWENVFAEISEALHEGGWL